MSSSICRKLVLCSTETETTLRGVASFIFVGFLLALVTDSVAQQNFAPLKVRRKLGLPNQPGDVRVYYNACCKERAMQVQSTLTDCVHFYKEKLGVDRELIVVVPDENDWNRVVEGAAKPHRFALRNDALSPLGIFTF